MYLSSAVVQKVAYDRKEKWWKVHTKKTITSKQPFAQSLSPGNAVQKCDHTSLLFSHPGFWSAKKAKNVKFTLSSFWEVGLSGFFTTIILQRWRLFVWKFSEPICLFISRWRASSYWWGCVAFPREIESWYLQDVVPREMLQLCVPKMAVLEILRPRELCWKERKFMLREKCQGFKARCARKRHEWDIIVVGHLPAFLFWAEWL